MEETMTSPMDAAQGAGTLAGREETHGRPYPHVVEKLGFILTVICAVFIGLWLWNESDWPNYSLWIASVCGLPLFTLIVSEMIGRIIHAIHVSEE